jgi:hypothetical protein
MISTILAFALLLQANTNRIDAAFQKFWVAASPEDAEHYIEDVIKSGVSFDEAYQRL